jgi:glucokinase
MSFLGIDIGGTKTAVCLGTRDGTIEAAARMVTKAEQGFEDYVRRTSAFIHAFLKEQGVDSASLEGVGMSAPGPLSVTRGLLLSPPNMGGWRNKPIVAAMEEALGRKIVMNNDANACVLAEWLFGEHKGTDHMIYLTMSTGLGAGIISGGQIIQGACDLGGECGYHVIDPDGPESPCGHRGSFEAFCGGKNVADRLRRDIVEQKIATAILDAANGDPANIDFKALLTAVREKDAYALNIWEDYTTHLAQGFGNLMMILNPEVIIMGTIGIHAGDLLLKPLREKLPAYVIPEALDICTIAPSSLGPQIGELSALALAIDAA